MHPQKRKIEIYQDSVIVENIFHLLAIIKKTSSSDLQKSQLLHIIVKMEWNSYLGHREHYNLINNRATKRTIVINSGMVEGAVESESSSWCNCFELEAYSLECSLPFRFEGSFEGIFGGKCFNHH